ncbi:hypothetical protein ACQKEY_19175 [Lysinibacillus fusiformis]|uniref:hypothetical protein n=1 Tax=Lysinibacillus fusiformis TaxID=28031 RepID=UPI000D39DB71|nr:MULTISPECIES: hypothetical protein [Lysinibacillus]MED4670512.1 hypothetical protein [Lysinibacillus fusiformis]QAS56747.1 hypothetical protein LSP_10420 [Lysinibacillus sphaericus]RDV32266.1 hypothetical protein C7B90_09815 [Lysinibacillus fusiformis]GED62717.1 hypothetical protein LFU01_11690 [Lysinibacillus fusiformis]
MFYLEYDDDTKLVIKIHETVPESVVEGHSIAKSDSFDIGMELEFIITVDRVDQDGNVTASFTTKQIVPAYQLLKKIDELEKENQALKGSVADLWETILVSGGNA